MRVLCLGFALSVALNIFQVLTRQEVQLCAKANTVVVASSPGLDTFVSSDRSGRGGRRRSGGRRRARTPKVHLDEDHVPAPMVPERGPTDVTMIARVQSLFAPRKELLLVLGVMSAEQLPAVGGVGDPKLHAGDPKARARRARAREYYQRLGVAEVLVKFFVDGAWLLKQTQPEPDDVVGIPSFGNYALELCGGWGHADLPGTCTTKEARLMSKARGWWRVARQWPARYYGQTDDDCGILTLPATLALTLTLRPSHPHSPITTQPSPCPHAPPSTLTLTPP